MYVRYGPEWQGAYKLNLYRERNTMDFLKELFAEPLSFEAFQKAVQDKGIKLADLSTGKYADVDKLTKKRRDFCKSLLYFNLKRFKRSALVITDTELKDIAAAPIMGLKSGPPNI